MTRLLSPIAAIKIGNDVFQTGDGRLLSASVTLGEDRRASQCSFSLADPELLISQKYFQTSFTQGGLKVPAELLTDPQLASYATTGSGATVSGNLSIRMRALLDMISFTEGTYGKGSGGYNIKGGGSTFDHNGRHPGRGAAGRYQFLPGTWNGLKLGNMTATNQDIGAVKLIAGPKATGAVEAGNLNEIFRLLKDEWVSLPGGSQPNSNTSKARSFYASRYAFYRGQGGGTATPATDSAQEATTTTEQVADFKGTSIQIGLGYSFDQLVYFDFVHVGTNASGRSPDIVTFEGQSVRWLMTRRKKNTSYSSISLKQLATKVAQGYGLSLKMDGEGPKYAFLDQTGLSDYGLLLRECNAIGYGIREEGKTLILQPWKANFTGFVITLDIVDELSFTDKASVEANNNAASVTTSTPSTSAGDRKQRIDRLSGKPVKEAKENKKATGSQGTKVSTGSPTKPVTGTAVLPGSETGLPNQKPGAIALSTGRAEAQDILDESRRVKGYESTAKFKTTPEALTLAPGSIIGIDKEIVPDVFSREWRISSLTHELSSSGMSTSLSFYSPQKQKPPQAASTATTGSLSPLAGSGTFIRPVQGGRVGDGIGAGRNHKGTDIAIACGTPVYAMAAGVVITSVNNNQYNSGAGNYVAIQHSNGIVTRYLHHTKNTVVKGQQVQQGQQIGTVGDTGRSKGCHTHIEFRKGVELGQVLSPADVGLNL